MKTKHLITVLLMISTSLGIVSCDNDDERFFLYQVDEVLFPNQAISGTTIDIVGGGSVGITGGKAPYTAKIEDEQIATVKVDADRVKISSVKLGTTSLVVKDADGQTVKIGVKVVEFRQSFMSKAVLVKIEGGNINEENKKTLEDQVIADGDVKATGFVRWVYSTQKSGEMTLVATDDNTSRKIVIPFVREYKPVDGKAVTTFSTNYEGRAHEFYLTFPDRPELDTRALGPSPCWLVEDVTEIYKTQPSYAGLALTSVQRIYVGSLSH